MVSGSRGLIRPAVDPQVIRRLDRLLYPPSWKDVLVQREEELCLGDDSEGLGITTLSDRVVALAGWPSRAAWRFSFLGKSMAANSREGKFLFRLGQYTDSMIVGACKAANVTTLYTEDMGAPTSYDGVQLVNPFI
jgi:hypothetical protein